ncbi:Sensor histidine kinase LiaS [Acaryochloris thomasi RCC1774]|uniref:Oxygen sensor histidine kinase NreB n=1 Tax=Acaryochloris thomasi RCC1774 TaxID=1764569 RepID=A0A2W1JLY3_9CYAN|nr:sensor histidine kinase [Acaryochloris thomasi]PZD71892.1 Sensor histidine kinase LiaS [Acaryochloris thomasi RCC1774]
MTRRATETIFTTSPSIPKILRYLEWLFLSIIALRILFPILYPSFAYEGDIGDLLVFVVFGLLAILSFWFPIHRPLWQRRIYIWVEIGCLLSTRLWSHWGLDLLLYLIIVKSCFLLSQREVIFTTIASGTAWHMVLVQYFVTRFSQPIEVMQAEIEEFYAIPHPLAIFNLVLNNVSIFITASSLLILLGFTIISERKSRYREADLAREVEILAADLERTRIARDIHDSLGHTLTSLDVQLELAQRLYERKSDQVQQALNTSKMLAGQSVREVRRAVTTMREEAFDLNLALTRLIESLTSEPSSLTVETKIDLPKLPLQTSHQLYCIVKEGLENIRRHSQAQFITLQGQTSSTGVTLMLEDNGIGFDLTQSTAGFGLRGMRERAQLIGGSIQVNSTPGKGTCLQVTVPQ